MRHIVWIIAWWVLKWILFTSHAICLICKELSCHTTGEVLQCTRSTRTNFFSIILSDITVVHFNTVLHNTFKITSSSSVWCSFKWHLHFLRYVGIVHLLKLTNISHKFSKKHIVPETQNISCLNVNFNFLIFVDRYIYFLLYIKSIYNNLGPFCMCACAIFLLV